MHVQHHARERATGCCGPQHWLSRLSCMLILDTSRWPAELGVFLYKWSGITLHPAAHGTSVAGRNFDHHRESAQLTLLYSSSCSEILV